MGAGGLDETDFEDELREVLQGHGGRSSSLLNERRTKHVKPKIYQTMAGPDRFYDSGASLTSFLRDDEDEELMEDNESQILMPAHRRKSDYDQSSLEHFERNSQNGV